MIDVLKKRFVAIVAIHISKNDPTQCGYGACRFLDELEQECILFAKRLRTDSVGNFKRCKPCCAALDANVS
jgi:hypothetical protein